MLSNLLNTNLVNVNHSNCSERNASFVNPVGSGLNEQSFSQVALWELLQ